MTLTDEVTKNIIRKLLKGEDYRIEVVTLINAEFLQFAIDFFKKIVEAKLQSKDITVDWYKSAFLNPDLPAKEIAINSGLNKKTIHNMFNSSTKEIIIDAANEHYDVLYESIKNLTESETELDLTLTIKFKKVSVDLNVSESLIVINTLAVKRSELRGGLWSTAGKRVEAPLMETLCKLYSVDKQYYTEKFKKDKSKQFDREIDFYLLKDDKKYLCEVKLMGRGNPESADAVIARSTNVFVADKLSIQNKNQLDHLGINWVELRSENGYKRFKIALENIGIPHQDYNGNLENDLEEIFKEIFS
ncbi:MAG: CfrBI family restriction endonuclease [Paludibacteraceae bacterium]|nr:CfrBI family restriction endonuclease [Paludibacteraceae bacterium]